MAQNKRRMPQVLNRKVKMQHTDNTESVEKIYMPTFGSRSKIHIIEFEKKTCLCGAATGRFWECVYGLEVFPQITQKSQDNNCKTKEFREWLSLANEHAPKAYFCKKCYELMIGIIESKEDSRAQSAKQP